MLGWRLHGYMGSCMGSDIILVEVPVPVTEALRNAKELSLSFVNGPLRSGFGNRYRYR